MKLLAQVRAVLRTKHYSPRTEESYVGWVRRFVRFHGLRHPAELGGAEVERFLSALAVEGRVSAATHNGSNPINSVADFLLGAVKSSGYALPQPPAGRDSRCPVSPKVANVRRRSRVTLRVSDLLCESLPGVPPPLATASRILGNSV